MNASGHRADCEIEAACLAIAMIALWVIAPPLNCSPSYVQRYGPRSACFVRYAEKSVEMPMSRARPSIGARARMVSWLFTRTPRRTRPRHQLARPRLNVCPQTFRRRSKYEPAAGTDADRLTVRWLARGRTSRSGARAACSAWCQSKRRPGAGAIFGITRVSASGSDNSIPTA